jgi:hypothetical protein
MDLHNEEEMEREMGLALSLWIGADFLASPQR